MSAVHGKATGVVLGPHNVTRLFNDITTASSTEATDATMFDSPGNAKEYVAGLSSATIAAKGKFVGNRTATAEVLENTLGADELTRALVVYGGWVPGNRVRLAAVHNVGFEVTGSLSDIVRTSLSVTCDGPLSSGYLLQGAAALEASLTGATVDRGAASNRAVAQLHVVDNTRSAEVAVTLQHSSNGTTWVDIIEDWAVLAAGDTATEFEELEVPVNRYARLLVTLAAGTGSVTVIAGIARTS